MIATPAEMLAAYVRAFESQRPEDVARFYLLPCTFIRPDGVWTVHDEPTVLTLVRHLIEHARSQNYARTDTIRLAVRPLAATLAELSGVFVRYDQRQAECGRFGFTYIVRAEAGNWRIVVAIAHDALIPDEQTRT